MQEIPFTIDDVIELFLMIARLVDEVFKFVLVPIIMAVGLPEATARQVATIVELIIILTLIAKLSDVLKWVLVLLLAVILIGALYPMFAG